MRVVKAGVKWELLSSEGLDEQVIATPAIAGSRIYVRTEGALYCFAPGQHSQAEMRRRLPIRRIQ